jgi:predicted ATP-grasp superfamily ATP-dependent carboligase
MEINGRFWGSLQLAIDAGVDFPALLVAAALGDRPEPVKGFALGVRTRWWWGDVDHVIARVRHRKLYRSLGGPLRAIHDFLLPGRNVNNEVFRFDDPCPMLRESIDWFLRR